MGKGKKLVIFALLIGNSTIFVFLECVCLKMHSIRNCFYTRLDKNQFIPIVFSTKLKLSERFTFTKPTYCFIISNGFTAPNFDVDVKERIVFNNRRSNSTSKKFTTYKEGEKSDIKSEDMKKLERELLQMSKHRRTVKTPTSLSSDVKKELPKEHSVKIIERRISDVSSPARSISEIRTKSVCIQTENGSGNSENNFYSNKERPIAYKRFWSGEIKNDHSFGPVYPGNDGFKSNYGSYYSRNNEIRANYGSTYYSRNSGIKNYDSGSSYSRNDEFRRSSYVSSSLYSRNGRNYETSTGPRSESVTSSPFHYYGSNNQDQGMSLFKWRRGNTPSKEELDEEIDRYMAEIKLKTPEAETENIDAFVEEYMMETEKCIKEHEIIFLD